MDDDQDLLTYSRRSALGIMAVGAGLVASDTLGFTNLTVRRGVKLNVDNDLNAVLEITANGERITDNTFDSPVNIDFTNNSNEAIDINVDVTENNGVDISVDGFDDNTSFNSSTESFNAKINNGSTESLEITVEESNSTDLSIEVASAKFGGVSVDLTRGNVTVDNSS